MRRIPIRGKALAITASITLGLVAAVAVTANQPAESASDTAATSQNSGRPGLSSPQFIADQQLAVADKKAVVAARQAAQKKAVAARQAAQQKAAAEAARKKAEAARQQAATQRSSRSQARQPIYSGDPRSSARSMLASYGWSSSQFSCLDPLWARESGWNPHASNSSSGAYGIPQSLPGSKMASAGADWRANPATQIRWGLGYIKARYGSPCAAYSYQGAHGYY